MRGRLSAIVLSLLFVVAAIAPGGHVAHAAAPPADPRSPRSLAGLLLEERAGRIEITKVAAGSPAARAGLLAGDILLVVDDVVLVDLDRMAPRDVFRIFDRLAGSGVRMVVGRGPGTLGVYLPLNGAGVEAGIGTAGGEITIGMKAPEFTARDLKGAQVSLAGLRGRPVLIEFWASWCPPCRDSALVLRRLAVQYGDRLAIVGVSVDEDPKAFEAFAYNQRLPGHQIHDGGPFGPISVQYGTAAQAIPFSVLISPEGVVLTAGRSLADKEETIARLAGPPAPDRLP